MQRQTGGIILPLYPRSYQDLKRMAIAEPITRTCLHKLNSEVFRRPINIKPKFWGKCDQCGYEFKQKPASIIIDEFEFLRDGVPDCPVCITGTIRPPNPLQRQELEHFIEYANTNDKRLIDVCKQLEYDMNTLDDYYLIQHKDYMAHKKNGKIIGKTRSVVRGDPELMRISADERQNIGVMHWTCWDHRDKIFDVPDETCDQPEHTFNAPLIPVWYVATEFGGKKQEVCYIRREVIHGNKYFNNPLYGFPPIITLYRVQYLHLMMIDYMYMYYKERKIPSGMLAMPEADQDALDEEVDKWHAKMAADPNYIPVFAIDPDAKMKPEFIRFFDKLTEMELAELRKEIKEVIGAFYGVMPVLLADTSTGGGLNNEGLQFTVTTRAVEYSQNEFNFHIFPRLLDGLMITDWKLELEPSEEQDAMAVLQRQAQTLLNIQTALDVGLDVDIIPHESEGIQARYSGKPQKMSLLGNALNTLWGEEDKPNTEKEDDVKSCVEKEMNILRGQNPDASESDLQSQAMANCAKKSAKAPNPQSSSKPQAQQPAPPTESAKEKAIAHNPVQKHEENFLIPLANSIKKMGFEDFQKARGQITEKVIKHVVSFSEKARHALEEDWVQGMLSMLGGFIVSQVVVHLADKKPGKKETEQEKEIILDVIKELDERMLAKFNNLSQEFFRSIYGMGIKSIEKEVDRSVDLSMGSEEVIQAFMKQEPFQTALKNLSLETSTKLRQIVIDGYKEGRRPTRQELTQRFRNVVSLEEHRLRTIARTESQRFFLIGRETGYNKLEATKGEDFLYIWRVRHDNRTSDICKEIERRVPSEGVKLEELKEIVYQVQREMMPTYWKPSWTPHPNCRSRMVIRSKVIE